MIRFIDVGFLSTLFGGITYAVFIAFSFVAHVILITPEMAGSLGD